jgi:hypothetical protein
VNIDQRIEALTQSVKLLAAIHKENEARAVLREKRIARLQAAFMLGVTAFKREWERSDEIPKIGNVPDSSDEGAGLG